MLEEGEEEEIMKAPGSQPGGDPAAAPAMSDLPSLGVSQGPAGTGGKENKRNTDLFWAWAILAGQLARFAALGLDQQNKVKDLADWHSRH
jgi:hypothetical protein